MYHGSSNRRLKQLRALCCFAIIATGPLQQSRRILIVLLTFFDLGLTEEAILVIKEAALISFLALSSPGTFHKRTLVDSVGKGVLTIRCLVVLTFPPIYRL